MSLPIKDAFCDTAEEWRLYFIAGQATWLFRRRLWMVVTSRGKNMDCDRIYEGSANREREGGRRGGGRGGIPDAARWEWNRN